MKDGSRGWMKVKDLRNLLIEVPGEWRATALDDKAIYFTNGESSDEAGRIDLQTEKLKLKQEA